MRKVTKKLTLAIVLPGLVGAIALVQYLSRTGIPEQIEETTSSSDPSLLTRTSTLPALADPAAMWKAPDWATVEAEPNASEIKYGRQLVSNTAEFLGPTGKVKAMSNGMNCQNCHLQAGTVPLGNNYSAVFATYPKMRGRSGTVEDIQKRINDCLERSLNGAPLELDSKEMKAMAAYINWVGKDVPKGESPMGSGLYEVPILDRAADPEKGRAVFSQYCQECHTSSGVGVLNLDSPGYLYPPLWGANSYNTGAGLFRLSRFAGFVKSNMPFGATFENPILSDEEAWDVAAYVNSLDRPEKDLSADWPDISKKPMDHPFGPYVDEFDEKQHKFGPFLPIKEAKLTAIPE